MVKVKATRASRIYNKALKEFHRIVEEGEEFEVTEERFKFLSGENSYHVVFVEPLEGKQIKSEVKKVKIDKPIEEPEIFVIEPGKEPVKVDEDLKPVSKPKASKKKASKEQCE